MDKNKEEELKATQEMAGGAFGSFSIGAGVFFTVLLGALILKYPGVTWTGVGQGVLLLASGFTLSAGILYLISDKKDIKSVFRRTSKESKRKGEKTEIIDVNPNSIHLTDKKQAEPNAPLNEAKAKELEEGYTNAEAKNQDNKQPSNTAKEDKRIRTSQA